jgi:hypothetical protein
VACAAAERVQPCLALRNNHGRGAPQPPAVLCASWRRRSVGRRNIERLCSRSLPRHTRRHRERAFHCARLVQPYTVHASVAQAASPDRWSWNIVTRSRHCCSCFTHVTDTLPPSTGNRYFEGTSLYGHGVRAARLAWSPMSAEHCDSTRTCVHVIEAYSSQRPTVSSSCYPATTVLRGRHVGAVERRGHARCGGKNIY